MNESIGDFRGDWPTINGGPPGSAPASPFAAPLAPLLAPPLASLLASPLASVAFYPADFAVRWSQCSATANFFADYFAAVDACRTDDDARREFIGTLSYIVNELLENAVKFSVGETVEVTVRVDAGELTVVVTNHVLAATAPALAVKFGELLAGDPQELLCARVEANAADPRVGVSGLGFLTMMSDYGARLGWRFAAVHDDPHSVLLTTMARLDLRKQ